MITSAFIKELKTVLNKHSIDSLTNIPDDLLSEYLAEHLNNLQKTLRLAGIKDGQRNISSSEK